MAKTRARIWKITWRRSWDGEIKTSRYRAVTDDEALDLFAADYGRVLGNLISWE